MHRPSLLHLRKGDVYHGPAFTEPPPSFEGLLRWHIVITEPAQERRTLERLKDDLGVDAYLPILHARVNGGRFRKKRIVERAMFPSYIFVPMPQRAECYEALRGCRGVHDCLYVDDRPALLTDAAIAALRKFEGRADEKWLQELASKGASKWKLGQTVWFDFMPYQRLLATIDAIDAAGRIEVMLDREALGRKVWPAKPHQLVDIDD